MDVALSEITENGGYVCSKGKVCALFDGLAWMKRISAYFTVVVMNDKTLLLLPLTWVTVLIES